MVVFFFLEEGITFTERVLPGITAAIPAHFTDPSGQYAVVHVSASTNSPFSVCTHKGVPDFTLPCLNGTPKLMGRACSGTSPIQCKGASVAFSFSMEYLKLVIRVRDNVVRKPNQPEVSGDGS